MKPMMSSPAESESKKRITRRERFLTEMEHVIPWPALIEVIEPHYPKGERGRPPIALCSKSMTCPGFCSRRSTAPWRRRV
jgi:IS5 family transposase